MDRNYEQEYKKAFEAAKGLHDAGNALTKKQMEIVFPQLAESEDERIRKWLVDYFSRIGEKNWIHREFTCKQIVAYLEKQTEPHFTKRNALFDKCVENCDPEIMKRVSDEVDEMLEKEQKPDEPVTDCHDLERAAENSWAVYEYRESPKGLYSTCYVDGFIAGAEWQKRKMMGDAYEEDVQEVYRDEDGIHCSVSVGTDYKPGTIVYVITIPKEEDND